MEANPKPRTGMNRYSASLWSPTRYSQVSYYQIEALTFAEAEQAAISLFHADYGEDEDCIVLFLEREYNIWE